jgi:hypothetical protein
MNIGNLVYQENQGNLRFGTITGKVFDEKGWAWFAVDWHDDGAHKRAMDWTSRLRNDGIDRYNRTYRADELSLVDPRHLGKVVGEHTVSQAPRHIELEIPAC